jgi:hypothetical protein
MLFWEMNMFISLSDLPTIHTVSVIELIKELSILPEVSTYLMNRETLGIPLRQALIQQLLEMDAETLVIDLAGVAEMSTSVTEEIGPILFEKFLMYHSKHNNVYLTYCNTTDEVANGLTRMFTGWGSANSSSRNLIACLFHRYQCSAFWGHQFLGASLPDALYDVLEVIYQLGCINSKILEEHGIKAASRKLNTLSNDYSWLIRRFQKPLEVNPRAWAYFYSPIVPVKVLAGV